MSTLRRLVLAGAFAVPLSLVIAGPSTAGTIGGPHDFWNAQSSSSYAGMGGAGTTDSQSGYDYWGHHWAQEDTAVAGFGGAAVTHSEESGTDVDWNDNGWDNHNGWDNDNHTAVAVAHDNDNDNDGDAVAVHHGWQGDDYDNDAVAVPQTAYHPDYEVAPAHHNTEVSYESEAQTAGMDGATSSHVASHAGEHHAVYDAQHLAAGPGGAASEGVHAAAVPEYASYHSWYAAAGEDGAAVHSVSAVADATGDADDNDWTDGDNDYDNTGWTDHHHYTHHHHFDYDRS